MEIKALEKISFKNVDRNKLNRDTIFFSESGA